MALFGTSRRWSCGRPRSCSTSSSRASPPRSSHALGGFAGGSSGPSPSLPFRWRFWAAASPFPIRPTGASWEPSCCLPPRGSRCGLPRPPRSRWSLPPRWLWCSAPLSACWGLTGVGGGIFCRRSCSWEGGRSPSRRPPCPRRSSGSIPWRVCSAGPGASRFLPPSTVLWVGAAVVGGLIGSGQGSRRLAGMTLRRLLALVLLVAGVKLILSWKMAICAAPGFRPDTAARHARARMPSGPDPRTR